MGVSETLAPHNPLHMKLDAKSFVQLTVWIALVLLAYMAAKFVVGYVSTKAKQVTGAVTQGGQGNPFFSGGSS